MLTRSKAQVLNNHPQAVEAFKEGVGSILRQWTALELAVYHQWGGSDSSSRAEALREELIELFLGPDKVYKDDISLLLEEYLECEFNTILEDGSPDELGEIIVQMWRECCEGNFTTVTNILAKEFVRHEMITQSQGLSGGDVVDDEDIELQSAAQQEQQIELGQTDEVEAEAPLPLVDADGWEVVNKSKNKRKNYKI